MALSWSSSSGAAYYGLEVFDVTSGVPVVNFNIASGTSYAASLTAGKQYRWGVDACNSTGCSDYSPMLYFQTPVAAATPAVPANPSPGSTSGPGPSTSNTSVTLSWNASTGATSYGLGVIDVGSGSFVLNAAVTSGTSYTVSLAAGKQYRWNVNACDTASCSGYSTLLFFQTPGTFSVPSTPANPTPGSIPAVPGQRNPAPA